MTSQEIITLKEQWDLIIRPRRSWWDLRLNELWKYRDLIRLLVWRDFVAGNKQTVLGPFWYLVSPIVSTIVFTIVFGKVAKLPTDGLPPFLFYMAGQTIWGYFYSCVNSTSNTFVANAGIFGKVYFPRLVVPVSVVISNLVSFGIRFGVFLIFILYFRFRGSDVNPNLSALLLPVLLLIMASFGLGLGIIVSSLTTKYRDLQKVLGWGIQFLLYTSTVIYPLSAIPENWRWLLLINPVTPVIEVFRYAFLGTSSLEPISLLYSAGCTLVVLMVGILIFNRVENMFMDTV